MQKKLIQYMQGLMFIPMLSMSSPILALYQQFIVPQNQDATVEISVSINEERAEKIDAYYAQRDMPLEGYGAKMVAEAEKNNIDWRLIPAIAIKESTAGKFACGYNPFGWGSCKIKFNSWDHAIETIAYNLGGSNPATARYYEGTTTEEKLYHYNGSVIPAYTGEVLEFMELIEKQPVLEEDTPSV
ncbi:glucosaminidase domain-containing protein [Patescibacteria group bacterium]|nr:glucosaminidase domain-containing protein [Patescibacteria group bacterium]